MANSVQKPEDDVCRNGSGNGFLSARSLSNYVASSVRATGASIICSMSSGHDDSVRDQVLWAGFDKLESQDGVLRQVLLLAYRYGFQVWDVEQADQVRQLESRVDASASFLQIQKKPFMPKGFLDRFADVRPLLMVAGEGTVTADSNNHGCKETGSDSFLPNFVHFYSMKAHEYVHVLKFRSAVLSVRCSPRVIAVSQTSQIHCFSSATLEREYTILTHPVVFMQSLDSRIIGYEPLAVGPRWLAYSGNPVAASSNCPASEVISPSTVAHSNGSLMANFARGSSKKLAAGLTKLGEIAYTIHANSNFKRMEPGGLVIVQDVVSRSIIAQFMAHKSPISALSFDPSGTLLATASVHGHNINVFRILPPSCAISEGSDATGCCIHLYKLQRGITNAIIQDISFSDDSKWIVISSSRGTSHLFAIGSLSASHILPAMKNKSSVHLQYCSCSSGLTEQDHFAYGNPVALSAASRIRSAAATAAGRVWPISVPIASVFHHCRTTGFCHDTSSFRTMYHLLVFAPSGSIVQYALRTCREADAGFAVEALQKWDVCRRQNRRDRCGNVDINDDHGKGSTVDSSCGNEIIPRTVTARRTHRLYLSEVELRSHEDLFPLWAKSEFCFEVLMDQNGKEGRCIMGEIEIEGIPCRTIETRIGDLVPVLN